MLDWKITGGMVLDGTGAPAVPADVGIRRNRIAALGDLRQTAAVSTVAATGRYVCPGFVDAHSHSDAYLLIEPSAPSKITQGITTEIIGNCGASAAPLADRAQLPSDWQEQQYPVAWRRMTDYLEALARARPATNIVALVGHGKLRGWVMGLENRPATADEVRAMERLLAESLEAGAWGLSTGLIYAPGRFAARQEIEALARVAARYGGIYTSHMRSEGAELLEAIVETIAVGRATGVRVEISHLKTSGSPNWRKVDAALDLIRQARAAGLAVAADRYPYTASGTDLDVVFPAWAAAGGRDAILRRLRDPVLRARLRRDLTAARSTDRGWETIIIASTRQAEFRGKPLPEVAARLGLDPAEAILHLTETDGLQTSAFFSGMSEPNLWTILAEPYVMLGTDSSLRAPQGPLGRYYPHPRAYGSFPRFLRAALDGKTVALPEAVRKMTALPAAQFRLRERGRLAIGALADIVIFNPRTVADCATFADPQQFSRGIDWVMVNGALTLDEHGLTGLRGGTVLRRA